MTRFAKRGFDNRKLNEATPWSEMKNFKDKFKKNNHFKEQRREERRMKRQADREASKVCYSCRGHGHVVSDCPFLSEANQQGSCFKCGSTEHLASACSAKIPKGSFPFAQCFICGEKGHISKQCPDNPRGLYPRGGSCKQCGSVEHLKRDCPQFLAKRDNHFKEQRREERRMKRQADREASKVCYSCRGHGHVVSDCPFLSEANQQGSCFKCGSTEHLASACSAKIPKGTIHK